MLIINLNNSDFEITPSVGRMDNFNVPADRICWDLESEFKCDKSMICKLMYMD